MLSEYSLEITGVSKTFQIFDSPKNRLKELLFGFLNKFNSRKFIYHSEFDALKNISFKIKKGETVGIIGVNGSGKSTLLQIICGTLNPTKGSLEVRGRISALLELGAGFNPEFTGRENIILNATILGFKQKDIENKIKDIIDFSEISDFLDQPVKTYSSGMTARLAFSIAIHVDPEILIVDEALAVGDARFVAKCMGRIKDIQALGTTIIFVSHDVSAIRTLCDRAIWINKGELVDDGDVFPVTGKYTAFLFGDKKDIKDNNKEEIQASAEDVAGLGAESKNNIKNVESDNSSLIVVDQPVSHWGSDVGIISSALVRKEGSEFSSLYYYGEIIEVVIKFTLPKKIDLTNIGVAFSIKDLKGSDIVVSSTYDVEEGGDLRHETEMTVRFEFPNLLVSGKYVLVAAIERRNGVDIHYYEYLEGSHYFAVVSNQRFFGVFQPKIRQSIEV